MEYPTGLDAFPRRALKVTMNFRETAALVSGALIGISALAAIIFFLLTYAPDIIADRAVYEEGEPVKLVNMEGKCLIQISFLPFADCRYQIAYDSGGIVKTDEVSALFFGGAGDPGDITAKVDRNDNSRIAISWFAEQITERWLALVGLCFGLALLGGVLVIGAWRSVKEFRLYRKLALMPQPIVALIEGVEQVSSPNYAHRYTYRYRFGEQDISRKQLFKVKPSSAKNPAHWTYEEPLFLNEQRSEALALSDGQGNALLVSRRFRPLVLTAEEQGRVIDALPKPDGH